MSDESVALSLSCALSHATALELGLARSRDSKFAKPGVYDGWLRTSFRSQ